MNHKSTIALIAAGVAGAAFLWMKKSSAATLPPATGNGQSAPIVLPSATDGIVTGAPVSSVTTPDGVGAGAPVGVAQDGTGGTPAIASPVQSVVTPAPTFADGPTFSNVQGALWASKIDSDGAYWLAPVQEAFTGMLGGLVAPSSAYKGPYTIEQLAAAGIYAQNDPRLAAALSAAAAAKASQQAIQQANMTPSQPASGSVATVSPSPTAPSAPKPPPAGITVNGVFVPQGFWIGGVGPTNADFAKISDALTARLPQSANRAQSNSVTTPVQVTIVAPGFSAKYFQSKGARNVIQSGSSYTMSLPLNMVVPLSGDSGVRSIQ